MERTIRFMRPFPDKPVKASDSALDVAMDSMLVYRPGKQGKQGILYVNRQAIEVLAHVGGMAEHEMFNGMFTGQALSQRVVKNLNREILSNGVRMAPHLVRIRNAFKKAAADPRGVMLVNAGTGQRLGAVKAIARHELHHAYETDLEPEQATEYLSDPLAKIASGKLVEDKRYVDEPVNLVSEIAAHLAGGPLHWREMGIRTIEQAEHLWRRYLQFRPDYRNRRIHPILLKDVPNDTPTNNPQRPGD